MRTQHHIDNRIIMDKNADKVDKPNGTDTAEIQLTEMVEDKSSSKDESSSNEKQRRATIASPGPVKTRRKSKRKTLNSLSTQSGIKDLMQELEGYKQNPTVMNLCEDLFVSFALQRPSKEHTASKKQLLDTIHRMQDDSSLDLNNRWIKVIVLTTENRLKAYFDWEHRRIARQCLCSVVSTCSIGNAYARFKLF